MKTEASKLQLKLNVDTSMLQFSVAEAVKYGELLPQEALKTLRTWEAIQNNVIKTILILIL